VRGQVPTNEAGARHRRARLLAPGALALVLAAVPGCGSHARHAVARQVVIRSFAYDPADLAAAPGDTVVWVNEDIVPHTATSAQAGWNTGSIAPDSSARVVLGRRSFGPYACSFHPNMKGILTRNGARPASLPHPSE